MTQKEVVINNALTLLRLIDEQLPNPATQNINMLPLYQLRETIIELIKLARDKKEEKTNG